MNGYGFIRKGRILIKEERGVRTMASTRTTIYSVHKRDDSNSYYDTVNWNLSRSRSSAYQGTAESRIHAGGAGQGSLSGQAYVFDNIARQPEVPPVQASVGEPEHRQKTSSQVLKNRKRALSMNTAYVVFLACAAIAAVVICFLYLRLQSETVSRSENITALQRELEDLTEKNDTAYQAAADSVNLNTVRDRALNELGMVYASQGRVVSYKNPTTDRVKQYNDIPENGVLAKSGNLTR